MSNPRNRAVNAVIITDPLANPPLIGESNNQQKLRELLKTENLKNKTPQAIKITKTYTASRRGGVSNIVFDSDNFAPVSLSNAVNLSLLSLEEQKLVFNKVFNLEIGVSFDGSYSGTGEVYFSLRGINTGKLLSYKIGDVNSSGFEPSRGVASRIYQERLQLFNTAIEERNDFQLFNDVVLFDQIQSIQKDGDILSGSIGTTSGSGGNFTLCLTITYLAIQQTT